MVLMACVSPDNRVERGPLEAATATDPLNGAISCRATSTASSVQAIPPCPLSRVASRLRRQITAAASAVLSAPATQAAAISPMLWPITTSGSTPQARHRAESATWTAQRAGCTISVRDSQLSSSSSISERRDTPLSA